MNKKLANKVVSVATVGVLGLGMSVVPLSGVSAQSVTVENIDDNVKNSELYKELSEEKTEEFQEVVNGLNMNADEQMNLLKQRSDEHQKITPKWKTALIKQAAKLLAAKAGEKTVAEWTDFLFEWEDDLQNGMEYGLVNYGHFNETAAHWTAKSIMFIVF